MLNGLFCEQVNLTVQQFRQIRSIRKWSSKFQRNENEDRYSSRPKGDPIPYTKGITISSFQNTD